MSEDHYISRASGSIYHTKVKYDPYEISQADALVLTIPVVM